MRAIVSILLLTILSCSDSGVQYPLPASMKGYELYSWQDSSGWNYTLITGTNRLKTKDEITAPDNSRIGNFIKITVQRTAHLKNLLTSLPAGESVGWIASELRTPGFPLPPAAIVNEIQTHCARLDLELSIVN